MSARAADVGHAPTGKGEVVHSRADIRAASAFGYIPSEPLETGVREYVAWMRAEAAR